MCFSIQLPDHILFIKYKPDLTKKRIKQQPQSSKLFGAQYDVVGENNYNPDLTQTLKNKNFL